ncbi:MAG: hypothetical protein ABFE08_03035 [Armatimonadia bacterium]
MVCENENHRTGYGDRYVAYLDIMGYSELVREAGRSANPMATIDRVREAVSKVQLDHGRFHDWGALEGVTTKVFSDSIIISSPGDQRGCFDAIRWTMNVVARLAHRDLWLRGAITFGAHYDEGGVLFSPALVKAYEMEQKDAFYPRVLVTQSVIQTCRAEPDTDRREWLLSAIQRDHDRAYFLNYLALIMPGAIRQSDEHQLLWTHKAHIEDRLKKHRNQPRIAAKYGWLADYHNRFCERALDDEGARTYLIKESLKWEK